MSDRELELLRIELKVAERQIQHWREHAQACQQGGEILKQELDRLRDQLQQLEWALSSAQDRADIAVRERDEARAELAKLRALSAAVYQIIGSEHFSELREDSSWWPVLDLLGKARDGEPLGDVDPIETLLPWTPPPTTPAEPEPMDCGNNPCFFATSSKGQRTQGTCRCMDRLTPELSYSRQRYVRNVIRETIAAHVVKALRPKEAKDPAE